jgi:hypothetical protein
MRKTKGHRFDLIQHKNLFVASTCSIARGPGYTYSSGMNKTTVDYIIADSEISCSMVECFVYDHHTLNFSDHLLLTISLELNTIHEVSSVPCSKAN